MNQEQINKVIAALEAGQRWADDASVETVVAEIDEALTIMRGVAAEPVALKRWPHRVHHLSELGYVVWRDVFEGKMKCSLLDAVLAHKTAVFVCEDDAKEYCAFINKSPQAAAISEAHAQGVREAPPGWKLVPIEPNEDMCLAAVSVPESVKPYPRHFHLIWDAMLAAAPEAP